MKHIKSISLFLTYTLLIMILGFFSGVAVICRVQEKNAGREKMSVQETLSAERQEIVLSGNEVPVNGTDEDTLSADTDYVLEEHDKKRETTVESVGKVPQAYLGMNREEFVAAMERYEASPPLSELERGFTGLEVLSFSGERVVIRMDYVYVEPTKSFYLNLSDGKIVVLCDDRETVYQYTEIEADRLPEELQRELIIGMYVENEEALYRFLETYSS